MSNHHHDRKHGQAGENSPTINPHVPQARGTFGRFRDLPQELQDKIADLHVSGDFLGNSAGTLEVFNQALKRRNRALKQMDEAFKEHGTPVELLEDVYGVAPKSSAPQHLESPPFILPADKCLVLSPTSSGLLTKWSDKARKIDANYRITEVILKGSLGSDELDDSTDTLPASFLWGDLNDRLFNKEFNNGFHFAFDYRYLELYEASLQCLQFDYSPACVEADPHELPYLEPNVSRLNLEKLSFCATEHSPHFPVDPITAAKYPFSILAASQHNLGELSASIIFHARHNDMCSTRITEVLDKLRSQISGADNLHSVRLVILEEAVSRNAANQPNLLSLADLRENRRSFERLLEELRDRDLKNLVVPASWLGAMIVVWEEDTCNCRLHSLIVEVLQWDSPTIHELTAWAKIIQQKKIFGNVKNFVLRAQEPPSTIRQTPQYQEMMQEHNRPRKLVLDKEAKKWVPHKDSWPKWKFSTQFFTVPNKPKHLEQVSQAEAVYPFFVRHPWFS
ncbi:hypothetical protein T439DRAFT_377590 [Meredithblackwellia eburnea MCA 4105]